MRKKKMKQIVVEKGMLQHEVAKLGRNGHEVSVVRVLRMVLNGQRVQSCKLDKKNKRLTFRVDVLTPAGPVGFAHVQKYEPTGISINFLKLVGFGCLLLWS
jgi:hypothetical protein